ncbi:MAG: glycosyltransferase family 39 protein [Bacteroidia bacterium]
MLESINKYLPQKRLTWFFLLFIINILFKSLYLDFCGYWYDESITVFQSGQDWGHIKHISEWDFNPPLHIYFIWIWRHFFGISEYSIRFTSALFSSLAAGMIFVFSDRFFNRLTAILSALIFSSSSVILFFAHEARSYSLILLLVLCSSWFFFCLLEKRSIKHLILLIIFDFMLIYTHYTSGMILVWQGVITILTFRKELIKQMALVFASVACLALVRFTSKTFSFLIANKKNFWLGKPGLYELKTAFYDYFNSPGVFAFYLILVLILLGSILKDRNKHISLKNNYKIIYILLAGIGTVLLCYGISNFFAIFLMRYFLFTTPFMFISIAYLVSVTDLNIRYAAVIAILLVCGYSFSKLELKTPKSMDYKNAMAVIKKLKTETTAVLVETKDITPLFTFYYNEDIFKDFYHLEPKMNEQNVYFVSSADDVAALDLARFNRIILTQSFDTVNPKNGELLAFLNGRYKKTITVNYYNEVPISVFVKN